MKNIIQKFLVLSLLAFFALGSASPNDVKIGTVIALKNMASSTWLDTDPS